MDWFKPKTETKYQVVPTFKADPLPEFTPELAEAVRQLSMHPGMQYLVRKLDLQRDALRAKLSNERHKDIREVEFLQSGIQWCDWLNQQFSLARARVDHASPRAATLPEISAIEAIELVGQERPQGER